MIVFSSTFVNVTWLSDLSLSAAFPKRIRLRRDVCMLNWLLAGDCDIWASNYYVVSCTVRPPALNLSLNISGQEPPFLRLCKKNCSPLWIQIQLSNPEHVINCPLYHQTCNLETSIFNFHFRFFSHFSPQVLPFNLDMTISYRKLSFLYLLTWQYPTLQLTKTCKGSFESDSSYIKTVTVCSSSLSLILTAMQVKRTRGERSTLTMTSVLLR